MTCQLHEDHIIANCSGYPVVSERSSITWNEKPYGYMLRFRDSDFLHDECNLPKIVPKPMKEGKNIVNYYCTLQHEVVSTIPFFIVNR